MQYMATGIPLLFITSANDPLDAAHRAVPRLGRGDAGQPSPATNKRRHSLATVGSAPPRPQE